VVLGGVEQLLSEEDALADQRLRRGWVGNAVRYAAEGVVEDRRNTGIADRAGLEVLHVELLGEGGGLGLLHRVLTTTVQVDLVADQDLYRDLRLLVALQPLLDVLEGLPFGD